MRSVKDDAASCLHTMVMSSSSSAFARRADPLYKQKKQKVSQFIYIYIYIYVYMCVFVCVYEELKKGGGKSMVGFIFFDCCQTANKRISNHGAAVTR